MDNYSGVGVLDKAVSVLDTLESGPAALGHLVQATGLTRPTAHRIAVALERHRLITRDPQGRFVLGPRIAELATAAGEDRLLAIAQPVLTQLRDTTGESAQLYRRQGDWRVCVAAAERASGLRDTVPVGAALPMTAGSGAQVLLAWDDEVRLHSAAHGTAHSAAHGTAHGAVQGAAHGAVHGTAHGAAYGAAHGALRGAKFTATALAQVRRRGWAASAAEREPGVASVSAPVRGASGKVVAAVSVSGPIERLTRSPGRLHAAAVVSAGDRISDTLRRSGLG